MNDKQPSIWIWAVVTGIAVGIIVWVLGGLNTTVQSAAAAMAAVLLMGLLGGRVLSAMGDELASLRDNLDRLSSLDGLTGLANRRYFDNQADREWRRACRGKTHLSMLIVDLKGFAAYNELFGQQIGDDALKLVGKTISDTAMRPGDVVARYGADEFAILLPETNGEGARVVANKIDAEVQALGLPAADGADLLTVSIGLAAEFGGREGVDTTASTLISTAQADLEAAEKSQQGKPTAATADDDLLL